MRFGPWQTVWKRHRRFSAGGTWDKILAELVADADGQVDWTVSIDSSVMRTHQHVATLARCSSQPGEHTGAARNDKKQIDLPAEPGDHGIGRSRGGVSTKAHLVVDGHGRPLVIVLTAGQAGDSPIAARVMRRR